MRIFDVKTVSLRLRQAHDGKSKLREMRHPYSSNFISKKCILSGNKQPDF